MKIVFPVEEKKKSVCPAFGRTPFFLVYDTETKDRHFVVNEAAEAQGGAGLKAAQIVMDLGAEDVVTYRLGENAGAAFQAADIKIHKASAGDLEENIKMAEAGDLPELTKFHAGFHGLH